MSALKFEEGRLAQVLVAPIISEKATSVADAAQLLARVPGVKKVAMAETEGAVNKGVTLPLIHVTFDETAGRSASDIPNVLVNHGFRISKFTEEPVNLETAFMRLTKGLVQ